MGVRGWDAALFEALSPTSLIGVATPFCAVIGTRRPGRDSISAAAELLREGSGHGRLRRPTELGAVDPDPIENNRELTSDGDARLLGADPLHQPHAPGTQW
jgi:hypothetical protein